MADFDVSAARAAGYSDDEILQHLSSTRPFDVQGALKSGYSKSDIIGHLATTGGSAPDVPSAPAPQAPQQGFISKAWDAINTPTADFFHGPGYTQNKLTQDLLDTSAWANKQATDLYNKHGLGKYLGLPEQLPERTTPPSPTLGNSPQKVAGSFGASLTSPLGIATVGVGPLLESVPQIRAMLGAAFGGQATYQGVQDIPKIADPSTRREGLEDLTSNAIQLMFGAKEVKSLKDARDYNKQVDQIAREKSANDAQAVELKRYLNEFNNQKATDEFYQRPDVQRNLFGTGVDTKGYSAMGWKGPSAEAPTYPYRNADENYLNPQPQPEAPNVQAQNKPVTESSTSTADTLQAAQEPYKPNFPHPSEAPEVYTVLSKEQLAASKKIWDEDIGVKGKLPEPEVIKSSGQEPPPVAAKVPEELKDKLITQAVGLMKEGGRPPEEALQAFQKFTGVAHEGLDNPALIHKYNNWLNNRVLQRELEKINAPQADKAPAPAKTQPSESVPATPSAPTTSKTAGTQDLSRNVVEVATSIMRKYGNDHGEALQTIIKAAQEGATVHKLPEEKRLINTLRAFADYQHGLSKGKDFALASAIDAAKQYSERGFLGSRPRYTDGEIGAIARGHVLTVLGRFEAAADGELKGRGAFAKLTSPQFQKQVVAAGDEHLLNRYNSLVTRSANLKVGDPVAHLTTTIGGFTLTPGDLTHGDLRQRLGEMERRRAQAYSKLEGEITRHDDYSIADFAKFTHAYESGDYAGLNDADRRLAADLNQMFTSRREKLQAQGKLENYIENYFPHMWSNKGQALDYFKRLLLARRPLEGTNRFLKPRYYDSIAEGMAAGLEPVTYNAPKLALMRLYEIDKYLMAHDVLKDMQTRGTAQYLEYGKQVPYGWTELNDRIFRGFKQIAPGERVVAGRYIAPQDAAEIINNYLAPGLRGSALYQTIRSYNNFENLFNLGFSALHATETSISAMASEMARGMMAVSRGQIKEGIGRFLSSPVAVAKYYKMGLQGLGEYVDPGTYAHLSGLVDNIVKGNAPFEQHRSYRLNAVEAFGRSIKQLQYAQGINKLPAAARVTINSVGAAAEKLSSPIMNNLVPRVKIGESMYLTKEVLDRLGPDAHPDLIRHEVMKAVDSVDNRLGEFNYDNLKGSPIMRDLGFLFFRSLGWNLGTARELGGGVVDVAKGGIKLTQGKPTGGVTTRMAYTTMLPVAVGFVNAALQWGMTGKPPDEWIDYMFPKTGTVGPDGKPNRMFVKNYEGDIYSFVNHPVDTILHKAAPVWSQAYDLYKNKDYFGREIRHTEDSMPAQVTEVAKYWLTSTMPFTLQSFIRSQEVGEGAAKSAMSLVGVLPAPRDIGRTPAEKYAYEKAADRQQSGPKTQEQFDRQRRISKMRQQYFSHQVNMDDLYKAVEAGVLAPDDIDKIADESKMDALTRDFRQLEPHQALRAWELANPAERDKLREVLMNKWDGVAGKFPKDEEEKLNQRFASALDETSVARRASNR